MIASTIIEILNNQIEKAEKTGVIIGRMPFSSEFLVIWNPDENDYFFVRIVLSPTKKYRSDKYDVAEKIEAFIDQFMPKKDMHAKNNTFVFFFNDRVFNMSIELKKVKKKNIISTYRKRKKNSFIDQKILSIIQDAGLGGISISDLTQKTQSITREERVKILNEFLKDEIIFLQVDTSKGRQKKMYFYEKPGF